MESAEILTCREDLSLRSYAADVTGRTLFLSILGICEGLREDGCYRDASLLSRNMPCLSRSSWRGAAET